jgi:hypothetical protein
VGHIVKKRKQRRPGFDQALRDFINATRKLSQQTGCPVRVTMTWDPPAQDYKGAPEKDNTP